MRVSQRMIFSNFMRDINKNRAEQAEIQAKLSDGREIRAASDGPVDFQKSRILEEDLRKTEQFQSNLTNGLRQARYAQDVLDNVIDELIEVKQIATRGSTDSMSDGDRETFANKIAGIRETLVNNLNTAYGERYLFGGTISDAAPFDLDQATGVVTYNGNNNTPSVLASDDVELNLSVNGDQLTNTPAGNMFDIIGDIEQELRNNDGTAVNNLMSDLDTVIGHVTDEASKLGDSANRMDFMFEQYESAKITQSSDISDLVDTDYAEAFSNLQRNQLAYESAMAVHSKMFTNTLLQYL